MSESSPRKSFLSSKLFHSLVGGAISLALIAWIAVSVEWSGVATELKRIHYWALIPSLAILLLHFYLRAWRWRFLLPDIEQRPSVNRLFDAIMLGNFATYILPLRAGEFVRPFALSSESRYSFSSTFVSVVIERFFDLTCVLFSFAIVVFYIEGIPTWVSQGAVALGTLATAIFAFIIVGSLFPDPVLRSCKKILKYFPTKVREVGVKFLTDFLAGAGVLSSFSRLLMVIVLTALVWLSTYLIFYIYFFLFEIEPSAWLAVTTAVIVALAVAAPSAPGFIGVYQTACIAGFELFGRTREVAVAYSVVTHIFQYILFGVCTLIFFMRSGRSFSSIMRPNKS